MSKIYKHNCKECGEYYEGRGALYCSIACYAANADVRAKRSNALTGKPSWNKGKKGWQSNDALKKWRENGGRPWNKGLNVSLSPTTQFTAERVSGEKNCNWKGGVTEKNTKLRRAKRYKEWREKVYARDRWHCVECEAKCQKGNIVAHHIKPFAEYPDLRYEVDNRVTFCRSCHAKEHNPFNKFSAEPNGKVNIKKDASNIFGYILGLDMS